MSTEQAVTPASGKIVATDIDQIDLKSEEVPVVITKRFNALKNVQLSMTEIEAKFYDELHELECKYAKLYEPHYEKRRQIVSGECEPNEAEGKWALDAELEKKHEAVSSEVSSAGKDMLKMLKDQLSCARGKGRSADDKGIVNFWLETLQSFRITSELIGEHDEPILSFLQDIKVTLFDKKPFGYTLEFFFAENPHFTNKTLTKTYELKTEVDPKDPFAYEGPDLKKSLGCKIDWKSADKNVTVKTVKKKVKSKNKKLPPKIVTKEEKQDSFFNFFDTTQFEKLEAEKEAKKGVVAVPSGADEDEEGNEEEDAEMMLYADFEIGQYMREKIVPKAILYFTGEYDDSEDYDDYEDEDEEDDEEGGDDDGEDNDEDGDDDDEDDSDDDGEDKKIVKKGGAKKGGKKAAGGKAGEPTPSECKQA